MNYENKIAELKADVSAIWKLQSQNLYNSTNLAALAVRECLQNSLDAVKGNKGKSHIDIVADSSKDYMYISDDGCGMNLQVLHEKFLNLGGTTKGDADNVGGFGLAKAVILGCGTRWSITTQDNHLSSDDLGVNPVTKVRMTKGTLITVYNPQVHKYKDTITTLKGAYSEFKDDMMAYVSTSIIPEDVVVTYNGEVVKPKFNYSSETHRRLSDFGILKEDIPHDTTMSIDVFPDKDYAGSHYLYVQLRGLTQYKRYVSWNANCNIVLNIDTKIAPRELDYPFSTNREGLKTQYQSIVERIVDKVSKSPQSVSDNSKYIEVSFTNELSQDIQTRSILSCISKGAKEVMKTVSNIEEENDIDSVGLKNNFGQRVKGLQTLVTDVYGEDKYAAEKLSQVMLDKPSDNYVNPLSYSWLMWEDKTDGYKELKQDLAVQMVLIWDTILKWMVNGWDRHPDTLYFPGIILQSNTNGLCVEKSCDDGYQRVYVMVNPLNIQGNNSTEMAMYLMNLAAHELAHYYCGCYEAHGEEWAIQRETLFNKNLSLIPAIAKMITKSHMKRLLGSIRWELSTHLPSKYAGMSVYELEDLAVEVGIWLPDFVKYKDDSRIYRMRLIMAIKKMEQEDD